MATRYVRSGASGAANGTSWTDAYTTLAAVDAVDTAGDEIYVADDHVESTEGLVTLAFAGTITGPNRTKLVCANDTATPPTSVATTATIATTGANDLRISGALYCYGISFSVGASIAIAYTSIAGRQTYEACNFHLNNATGGSRIQVGLNLSVASDQVWDNCTVKFGHASQALSLNVNFAWRGGSIASGGTAPAALIVGVGTTRAGVAEVDGVDLSNGATGMHLFAPATQHPYKAIFRNCKLPASWSGSLVSGGVTAAGLRAEMYNCAAGATNYALWVVDYYGSIRDETTIVRTGGASDGTTPLSWKMVSTANTAWRTSTLMSPEIVAWNEATGGALTATVEIVTDNVTLTDRECWLEVQYLGSSAAPVSTFVTDAATDYLTTGANQTTSSETWTTTGLTTPVKQKLSVTFTPEMKGFVQARVFLAKASTTVYVDPKIQIS
jgi:hypothetical protein